MRFSSSLTSILLALLPATATVSLGEETGVRLPQEEAELQLNMANELYAREMYTLAADSFKKYLKLKASLIHPRRAEGLYRLGECLVKLKQLNDAVSPFDQLIRNHPESSYLDNALFRRGTLRFVLNDPDKAIPDLERLLKRLKEAGSKPPAGSASESAGLLIPTEYYLGRAYSAKGRFPEARPLLADVAKDKKNDSYKESLFYLSELVFGQKRWDEARKNYAKYLKEFPSGEEIPLVNLRIGTACREMKAYDKAIEALRRIPPNHKYSDTALYLEVASFYQKPDYAEVLKSFAHIEKIHPDNDKYRKTDDFSSAIYMAEVSHFKLEQYKEVVARFRVLAAGFPAHPEIETAQWMACMSLYYLQDFQGMQEQAESFLKKFPESKHLSDINFLNADGLFGIGRFKDAILFFQKVPSENSFHQEATYRIAICYLKQAETAKTPADKARMQNSAASSFDLFVSQYPKVKTAPKSVLRSAELYQALEKYSEAELRFSNFLTNYEKQASPDEIEHSLFSRGQCQLAQGKFKPMAVSFSELLKRFPKTSHATYVHYWIGRHYEARKEWDSATHFYQAPAREASHEFSDDAIQRLANCYYRSKQFDSAADTFFEIFRKRPKVALPEEIAVWLADHYTKKNRLKDSIWVYQNLLEIHPETKWRERCLYKVHLLYFKLKDWKNAADWGSRLIAAVSKNPDKRTEMNQVVYNTAYSYQQLEKFDQAEPLYVRLIQEGAPAYILKDTEFWIGKLYYQKAEYKKALSYLLRVGLLTRKYGAEAQYLSGLCLWKLSEKSDDSRAAENLGNLLRLWEGKGERKGTIQEFPDSKVVPEIKAMLPKVKARLKALQHP